jgi:hypothetical protein
MLERGEEVKQQNAAGLGNLSEHVPHMVQFHVDEELQVKPNPLNQSGQVGASCHCAQKGDQAGFPYVSARGKGIAVSWDKLVVQNALGEVPESRRGQAHRVQRLGV